MNQLSKTDAENLFGEIREALQAIAKRNGMSLSLSALRWEERAVQCKVEVAVITDSGVPQNKMARDYVANARFWGLSGVPLGATFKDKKGVEFKIVGAKMRSSKPILCENVATRALYLFPAEVVAEKFPKAEGAPGS